MAGSPKFKPGQRVEFVTGDIRPKPLGRFEIVRLMPSEHGVQQYRIRSVTDGHERMAAEFDLV